MRDLKDIYNANLQAKVLLFSSPLNVHTLKSKVAEPTLSRPKDPAKDSQVTAWKSLVAT